MATNTWSEAETYKLIELWGNDKIQSQLEGCKQNKTVYERVARSMCDAGFNKSAEKCREKAKKLKGEYRKIKDKHRITGEGRKKWKFLDAMDNVLADKPSTQPPTLIDTLSEDTHDTNPHFEDDKQSDKHSDCPVSSDERASSAESEVTSLQNMINDASYF